jgi:predicted dehydrogenase
VNVFGTSGRIEIEIPFNAPSDKPCKMWHEQEGNIEEIVLPTCDQYALQGDLFACAVLDDTPVPTPLKDAVANMQVIESLIESGKQRGWVTLP